MKITKVGNQNVTYVEVGNKEFCVSYHLPIGYVDFFEEVVYVTEKRWSNTTSRHLRQWRSKWTNNFFEKIVPQEVIALAYEAIC